MEAILMKQWRNDIRKTIFECVRFVSQRRCASSSSSSQWLQRQSRDQYSREATVRGLKSRAAFKLLQINQQHRIFRRGQTVVDLGFAPGSWSQVAVSLTFPKGRVIGVDTIPAQPPKGVSTIQGNFLSPVIQAYVRDYLKSPSRGVPKARANFVGDEENDDVEGEEGEEEEVSSNIAIEEQSIGYIDRAEHLHTGEQNGSPANDGDASTTTSAGESGSASTSEAEAGTKNNTVDVVLSDMSAPWIQDTGFYKRSLSDPYYRMMNTSGISFSDHAGSMDLCNAALTFADQTLKPGGHFVCKFYQGREDKGFEHQLKRLFAKVYREKPQASRDDSKEAYFVALQRKGSVRL